MTNTNSAAVPRGMANMGLWADDVDEAIRWYTEVLGIPPYFVRPVEGPPQYAEFRIGDYQDELGIIDRRYAPVSADGAPSGRDHSW